VLGYICRHANVTGQIEFHPVALAIVEGNSFYLFVFFQGPKKAGGGILSAGQNHKCFVFHSSSV
jgi:hypothetical protein